MLFLAILMFLQLVLLGDNHFSAFSGDFRIFGICF